jgi:spore coat protein CotF
VTNQILSSPALSSSLPLQLDELDEEHEELDQTMYKTGMVRRWAEVLAHLVTRTTTQAESTWLSCYHSILGLLSCS